MNRAIILLAAPLAAAALTGCGRQAPDGPPAVRLGDSVCDQCNMIISDERWATATIVDGPRGADPRLFDDFNCQVNYERAHTSDTVLARWSHSHATREWIPTEQARFLFSPGLRTPMGSRAAAFATEAEALSAEFTGQVVDFEAAWARLGGDPAAASDAATDTHKEPDGGP